MSANTCFWTILPCGFPMGKFMDVSTKHITRNDDELLNIDCDARLPGAIVFRKDDIGYFVHVPHDFVEESEQRMIETGYSKEFIRLMQIARSEGASLLCIAADSSSSDKMPSFDW